MSDLSPAEILGAINERLTRAGFVEGPELSLRVGEQLRSFEDDVSIIGVVQFRSWTALRNNWVEAQSTLVDLLTERLDRSDPKVWEGYLVLLTLDQAPNSSEVDVIRRDTARLRKIVATGEELGRVSQVDEVLLPVLPLSGGVLRHESGSILARLPMLLDPLGIDQDLAQGVVAAFESDLPLMEAVATWRDAQ